MILDTTMRNVMIIVKNKLYTFSTFHHNHVYLLFQDNVYLYASPNIKNMSNLNAPTKWVWLLALVLLVLGLIGKFADVSFLTANAFWFAAVSAVLLLLASKMKGM